MRKDVKAGLVLSLIVVVVVGWYYLGGGEKEKSIPLGDANSAASSQAGKAPPSAPKPAGSDKDRAAGTRRTHARRTPSVTDRSQSSPLAHRTEPSPRISPPRHRTGPSRPAVEPAKETAARGGTKETPVVSIPPQRHETADEPIVAKAPETDPPARTEELTARRPAAADTPPPAEPVTAPDATETTGQPSPAVPSAPATETYIVQQGDTFAILAEVFYGSQRYAKLLVDANPQVTDPTDMKPGTRIKIPPLPDGAGQSWEIGTSRETSQATASGRTYVVQDNDTFWRLADRFLGSGARWNELFELNKDVVRGDPTKLRPGMVLKIPESKSGKQSKS